MADVNIQHSGGMLAFIADLLTIDTISLITVQ